MKNPTIGSCPCPMRDCSERADVRKFASRHTRDTGRRLAGKLYLDCPKHGRIGMDGRLTDWILEHAKISAEAREAAEAPAPTPPPPSSSAPTPAPLQPTAARARESDPPSSAPPPAKKRTGWGFFDA